MNSFSKQRLDSLKNKFAGKRIAVIGDMMLDAYLWGDVSRVSPEAPVPVVEIDNEFFRFGGAANVALNVLKLGGEPVPIGIIGNDTDGLKFNELMSEAGINSAGILIDDNRPTTSKTRVIANDQHVVRIDREIKTDISADTEKKLADFILQQTDNLDGIILQDYNKGVLTDSLIKEIITAANKKNILITVDPKFKNFFQFENVTLFKPNKSETENALGIRISNHEDAVAAGKKMLLKLNSQFVLLTLGKHGIILFQKNADEINIPTKARKVADVSGAGDTVISTLTLALAAGAEIQEAAYLANYAGGLVCEEVGIVPIELEKLFNTVRKELE
ncbi:MAG: D-glycero-beta-D-manno-heptose-7-phosphate kinase [Melioribacteraceae bacterium]|nr:D-glycero-beta-D-manno-heptose-7-phosphate kinase [Melioribacteraceae bacterium]MCF8354941.1 D-glycero-beta-D-manno-heptose-7-phosphate kinase [Melioribacteraceae bacterium]MCF8392370.1 D-glycero-beta-D-manno-heptose-7-phosphate kinase [Melioribacteraceae bacterium]MCF8417890.1 D-glycero-beta-D-manno-heptose-7-phosphate kinase [Melioribacteraceae bacterium]